MQQLFAIHSLHRIELDLLHHSILIYLHIYFLIQLSYQNTCPYAISNPLEQSNVPLDQWLNDI